MSFSKKMGLKEKPLLQTDGVSQEFKNRLRNTISEYIIQYCSTLHRTHIRIINHSFRLGVANLVGDNVDNRSENYNYFKGELNQRFFQGDTGNRWEIYDFIEYLYSELSNSSALKNHSEIEKIQSSFVQTINNIFEKENSAYRLTKQGKVIAITNPDELESIDTSLSQDNSIAEHIEKAGKLLKDSDYKSSIKESISAVEATCRLILSNEKITLTNALKELESNDINIHPALKESYITTYGFAGDEGGIRHSNKNKESSSIGFDLAKYMLVSCSAFTNYLISLKNK